MRTYFLTLLWFPFYTLEAKNFSEKHDPARSTNHFSGSIDRKTHVRHMKNHTVLAEIEDSNEVLIEVVATYSMPEKYNPTIELIEDMNGNKLKFFDLNSYWQQHLLRECNEHFASISGPDDTDTGQHKEVYTY